MHYITIINVKTLNSCYITVKRCDLMSLEEIIEGFCLRLLKDKGFDVIINDRYGLLNMSDGNNFNGVINGWHNNPYCMKIKSNMKLWNRCVYLKRLRDKKILKKPFPTWHVCYCGVAEYVIPIVFNKVLICEISVVGFKGDLSPKMMDVLSNRIGMEKEEFFEYYNNLLNVTTDLEDVLHAYLMPIKELILKLAIEKQKEGAFFNNTENSSGEYVTKALDFINNNFTKSIVATDVANHCNLSLSHLQHLFSKHHVRGVFAEIIYKRIEMACYMLKNTNCSVKEIALNTGFKNVDYFSTAFKKQCGVSPLKYRK